MTPTENPSKAAIYLRVSSDPQQESIPGQERDLKELCKSKGWRIVARFEDAGFTGTNDRRPEFQRMLKEGRSKTSRFDVIVIWDTTRFGRSLQDLVNVQHLLDRDVRVYTYRENYFLDPDDIRTVVGNYTAREDITRKRVAVPRGQKEAVRRGHIGIGLGSLFGYKSEFRVVADSLKPRRFLVPDPETAPIVRKLFTRFVKGDKIRELARWLNDTDVPTQAVRMGRTPKGITHGTWFGTTVRKILSNPQFTGYLVYGRQTAKKTLDGNRIVKKVTSDKWTRSEKKSHEALVSEEVFEEAQAILREPTRFRERNGPTNFILNLGRCKTCGGPICLQLHGAKPGTPPTHYFYCRQKRELKKGGKDCSGGFRYDFVLNRITTSLAILLGQPNVIAKSVKQFNAAVKEYEGNGEMQTVDIRIGRLERSERNLLEAIKRGDALDTLTGELSKVSVDLSAAREQREELRRELAAKVAPLDESTMLADSKSILAAVKKSNLEAVRRLLPSLTSRIEFDFTKLPFLKQLKSMDHKLAKAGFKFEEGRLSTLTGWKSSWSGWPTSSPSDVSEAANGIGELTSARNTFANLVETQAVTIWLRYDPANLESLGQEALEKVGAFVKTGRRGA